MIARMNIGRWTINTTNWNQESTKLDLTLRMDVTLSNINEHTLILPRLQERKRYNEKGLGLSSGNSASKGDQIPLPRIRSEGFKSNNDGNFTRLEPLSSVKVLS